MIVEGGVAFRRISQTSNQHFIRIYTPKRRVAAFLLIIKIYPFFRQIYPLTLRKMY